MPEKQRKNEGQFEQNILLNIYRQYSKEESFQLLIQEISKLKFKIGEQKSEISELEDQIARLKNPPPKTKPAVNFIPKLAIANPDQYFVQPPWHPKAFMKDAKNKSDMHFKNLLRIMQRKVVKYQKDINLWRDKYFNLLAKTNKTTTMKKIALCMPCYGRPERTKRAIESILAQTITGWEAYVIGDCCPDFEAIKRENDLLGANSWVNRAKANGNELYIFSIDKHEGGYGAEIRNFVMMHNKAEFLIFLDNDDVLQPNHMENYLAGIDGTEYDFVYFNTNLKFVERSMRYQYVNGLPDYNATYIRDAKLEPGSIGHAELIIRCSFLKNHPEIKQTGEYGHDWSLIDQMIKAGAKHCKSSGPATYDIMGAGELRETGID